MRRALYLILVGLFMTSTFVSAQVISIDSFETSSISDQSNDYLTLLAKAGNKSNASPVLGNVATNVLLVKDYGFKSLGSNFDSASISAAALNGSSDEEVKVTQAPLCYPNPFRQEKGAEIRYTLSTDADIDIHMYDMLSNLIYKGTFKKGSRGGSRGINPIMLNSTFLDNYSLPAGVYFLLVMHQGKVLAKLKMAVVP